MRNTDLSTIALTLIAGLALLVAPACTESQEPDESPREQSAAMQTVILDVTLPENTDPSQVEAIAKSAEKLAGSEVVGAKVKARQQKDGPMILTIEVWGPSLENPDAMIEGLRAEHPILVDTPIAVGAVFATPTVAKGTAQDGARGLRAQARQLGRRGNPPRDGDRCRERPLGIGGRRRG